MTSKTDQKAAPELLARLSDRFARTVASAPSLGAWLGPAGSSALALLILLVFLVGSLALIFPWHVKPSGALAEQFSAERALAHLPVIAREPHPQGSPAQARVCDYLVGQLTAMGLEVEVQRKGSLANVVARLPGTNPTGAIVILAHYDTVSRSPGAADNGSGVTVLLELMRALAAGPAPANDVIALFDDGEEYPDIFAETRAFVRSHPWMGDVRVAISIDTAVAGPVSVNEAGPHNGWLVNALVRARAPHPEKLPKLGRPF